VKQCKGQYYDDGKYVLPVQCCMRNMVGMGIG